MKKTATLLSALFLLTFSLIFFSTNAYSTTYTASEFGFDWEDEFSWENFEVPPDPLPPGDAIVMPANVNLNLNSTITIQGTLTIESSAFLFLNGGSSLTNSGTISGAGKITINPSSSLINSGMINLNDLDWWANATFTNTGTYTLPATGTLFLRVNSLPSGTFNWTSGGEVRVLFGGNLTIDSPLTIPSGSTLSVYGNGGSSIVVNSSLTVPSGSTLYLGNSGLLTISGTLELNGLLDKFNGTVVNNGTIKGTGELDLSSISGGPFTNNSFIAPGASPGKLNVTGDIDFGSGTYTCEINGTGQGTTYDWLDVSGEATVNNISLNLIFGFEASVNQTFDILTASPVSGTFGTPSITNVGNGNVSTVTLSYIGSNTVRVTVTSLQQVAR